VHGYFFFSGISATANNGWPAERPEHWVQDIPSKDPGLYALIKNFNWQKVAQ